MTAGQRRNLALSTCAAAFVVVCVLAITWLTAGQRSALVAGTVQFRGDSYSYLAYVPASARAASGAPLVVVLHGCRESAADIAAVSGFDVIARRQHFAVLYPEVDAVDLTQGGCWKGIWQPQSEGRGRGDAAAIVAMTATVVRRWRLDGRRVYVVGISAGAYETSILGAAYPDTFAAIGIHSGAPYDGGALGCLTEGETPQSTATLAGAALRAMASHARVMPTIVIHGDQDPVIPLHCGQQALQQWLETDSLVLHRLREPTAQTTPTRSQHLKVPHGHRYIVSSYLDQEQCPVAQMWVIIGMHHAWSGGSRDPAVAQYSDPKGPSAASAFATFLLRWRRTGRATTCARAHG